MRRDKKQEDDRQMKLDFQAITTFQVIKPIETKHPNADLSKKSSKSRVKKRVRSFQQLQGVFFDNLITVEELAVIFGLAPQTIRNWVVQRKLPYVKIGKRNLFLMRSVQEWLNRKEKPLWQ